MNATVPASVTITTTADVSAVKPGESVPIHADTGEATSSSSGGSSSGGSSMPAGDGGADAAGGAAAPAQTQTQVTVVFQMFIDTVSGSPLVVSPNPDFDVTIPATTPAGKHKLICRLAHSDGTTTDVTSSIDITVTNS